MSSFRYIGDLSNRGPTRVRLSRLRQVIAGTVLAAWLLLGPLLFVLGRQFAADRGIRMALLFHRVMARIFNLEVVTRGAPAGTSTYSSTSTLVKAGAGGAGAPVMFVANHASYLDVFVLGSLVSGYFVAKADVARWPVFGKLAGLQNTIFIERDPRRAVDQIETLKQRMREPSNLIVFPEGTSTEGTQVRPFRPTLFAAVLEVEQPVQVQPVSIAYLDYDGEPMLPADRDFYAWYLPMTFLPHFVNALGLRRARVEVTFHEPLDPVQLNDRKQLAVACEAQVAKGLETALQR